MDSVLLQQVSYTDGLQHDNSTHNNNYRNFGLKRAFVISTSDDPLQSGDDFPKGGQGDVHQYACSRCYAKAFVVRAIIQRVPFIWMKTVFEHALVYQNNNYSLTVSSLDGIDLIFRLQGSVIAVVKNETIGALQETDVIFVVSPSWLRTHQLLNHIN